MRVVQEVAPTRSDLRAALAGLVARNELVLRADPHAPRLYQSGVVYRQEPRGQENWRTLPELLVAGWGDCEDLSAARAAELRVSGEDPDAIGDVYRSGQRAWHAVVRRGDGSVEDPSLHLGMRPTQWPLPAGERYHESMGRTLAELGLAGSVSGMDYEGIPEDFAPRLQWRVQRLRDGSGWRGSVTLRLTDQSCIQLHHEDATRADAIMGALEGAESVGFWTDIFRGVLDTARSVVDTVDPQKRAAAERAAAEREAAPPRRRRRRRRRARRTYSDPYREPARRAPANDGWGYGASVGGTEYEYDAAVHGLADDYADALAPLTHEEAAWMLGEAGIEPTPSRVRLARCVW